jgi:hypothetical protein
MAEEQSTPVPAPALASPPAAKSVPEVRKPRQDKPPENDPGIWRMSRKNFLNVAGWFGVFGFLSTATVGAGWWLLAIDVPLFLLSTASVSAFYFASQREIGRGFWRTLPILPALMAIGIGLSVNNARAVFSGMFRRGGEFARTPKHNVTGRQAPGLQKRYRGQRSAAVFVETALAIYLCVAVVLAVHWGRWAAIPFLVLFCWGFGFTAALSIRQRLVPSSAFGGD